MDTHKEYKRLRKAGWAPPYAIRAARIARQWARLEKLGLVRLRVAPDEHADIEDLEGGCFSPRANPCVRPSTLERQRKALHDRIDQEGVWGIIGEYRAPDGSWEYGDGCWGFVGEDWRGSGYDDDIRGSTIRALRDAIKGRCRACRGTGERHTGRRN